MTHLIRNFTSHGYPTTSSTSNTNNFFFNTPPPHNSLYYDEFLGGSGSTISGSDSSSGGGVGGSALEGAAGGLGGLGVLEYAADGSGVRGPHIVAMDQRHTQHQEAYYLFFVGSLGMALNIIVVVIIFLRRTLRRMTSAFLIHASFLNLVKALFCIPFGLNLLSDADGSKGNQPPNCVMQGSSFIVLLTTSAFNMVAMVCTEAYTFGEVNVGGNSHGTTCCITFGVIVVYITAVILHLGPTLIGGDITYNPDIGSCAFKLGHVTGYVANIMCIVIVTFALVGVGHFLNKFYKEIQQNRPNRVSMLIRHSISFTDDEETQKESVSAVQEMTQDAIHRAKIFVITAVAFVLCWYPLFILILMDMHFTVSPKVYQAFSFIAWSHPVVEPVILIFFDRNLNVLARFMYCDREHYNATQLAYLLSQHRNRHRQQQHQTGGQQDLDNNVHPDSSGSGGAAAVVALNSHNISMEIEDAFQNANAAVTKQMAAAASAEGRGGANTLPPPTLCRHCSSPASPAYNIITSSSLPRHQSTSSSRARSNSGSDDTPVSSSTHELRGFQNFQPLAYGQGQGHGQGHGHGHGHGHAHGQGQQTTSAHNSPDEMMEMMTTPTSTSTSTSARKGHQHHHDPDRLMRDADGNGAHATAGNIQC